MPIFLDGSIGVCKNTFCSRLLWCACTLLLLLSLLCVRCLSKSEWLFCLWHSSHPPEVLRRRRHMSWTLVLLAFYLLLCHADPSALEIRVRGCGCTLPQQPRPCLAITPQFAFLSRYLEEIQLGCVSVLFSKGGLPVFVCSHVVLMLTFSSISAAGTHLKNNASCYLLIF